jgi:outer membrane protein TolC
MLVDWSRDERAERARRNVARLHDAGEVSATDLAGLRRRMHTLRHEIMENAKETTAAEIGFLRLLGLRPGCRIELSLADVKDVAKPSANDDPLELVRHPKVAAALMRLGGTEHALHAEIRRQYPDLKLGPAYVNEEGLDRFGLVAGVSIPLWNRNRKGIAEAEAARDEARLAAIDAWRTLVCDAAEARANLTQLLEHPPVPSSEREHADRLADAGELTPLEYLAVRDEIMEFELADVDWRRDVALAVAELKRLKANR